MKKLIKLFCLTLGLAGLVLAGCQQPTDSDEGDAPQPPGAPGNVQLITAERQLTVTWEESEGAGSYEVYYGRAGETGAAPARPGTPGENVTRYGSTTALITSLTNRTTYYVWVKAINNDGEAWSEPASGTPQPATTPPGTPKNIEIWELDSQLLVSWDPADGATSYELYAGTGKDSSGMVKKAESGGLSGIVGGLENGTEYTVWVKAKNSAGLSPLSAPVRGTPVAMPVFEDLAEFAAYVKGLPENTAANPHPVALSGFNLSNGDLSWSNDPLGKIYFLTGTKYLSLDLSACTGNLGNASYLPPAGKNRLVNCVLPEGLTSIGDYAFSGCATLASLSLPESLASIGDYAFQNCSALASLSLPESLASIGDYTFTSCTSLESLSLPEGLQSIGEDSFSYCSSLRTLSLPESLTSIGDYAFSDCTSLEFLSLPESLENTGNYVFQNCTSLESLSLPEGLENIGPYTFSGCTSLRSLSLPEGLENIGNAAFFNCTSLESLSLPEGLENIGFSAFNGCSFLVSVTIHAETPPAINANSFPVPQVPALKFYVPADRVGDYKAAAVWNTAAYVNKIFAIAG